MDKQLRLSLLLALAVTVGTPQWATASNGMTKTTQQNGTVKGRVIDGNGEPIIGASVQVKGMESTGTISNLDGTFSISGVTSGMLIVSYVGYETREVKFVSGQELTVALKEDQHALSEVVVVGYGTQKKANLTGSVASVNFNDVANRVRGVGTLGSGSKNNPMVLIDGIESSISQMSALAAEDIESVSVLKDAASAAIYGVRAANGVILVTTKRGADMRPTITYSGSIALQEATVLPYFVNNYLFTRLVVIQR